MLKVDHLKGCPETGKEDSPRVEFYPPNVSPEAQKQPGNKDKPKILKVGHCCECGEMTYFDADDLRKAEARELAGKKG